MVHATMVFERLVRDLRMFGSSLSPKVLDNLEAILGRPEDWDTESHSLSEMAHFQELIDERRGELFVANDTGNSVLVFKADAAGDVAPIRVLKGPNTGLNSPAGIFLDTKNDELWVSNYGNHALTVYSPTADGDTPPLRTIRSGPTGSQALMIGNPGALAYDTKREELLVPN